MFLQQDIKGWYFFVYGMLILFIFHLILYTMSFLELLYNWRLVTKALQKMKGKIPEIAKMNVWICNTFASYI